MGVGGAIGIPNGLKNEPEHIHCSIAKVVPISSEILGPDGLFV
jgi:hypothetical protein